MRESEAVLSEEPDWYADLFDAVLAALEAGESVASVEDAINAAFDKWENG